MGAWDFTARAVCAGLDPAVADRVFFPDEMAVGVPDGGERAADGTIRDSYRLAHDLCAACPVRVECLAAAVASGVREGIWAGVGGTRRRTLAARMRAAGVGVDGDVDARARECAAWLRAHPRAVRGIALGGADRRRSPPDARPRRRLRLRRRAPQTVGAGP